MNIVFWLIVIVALVLLWFCLSFAFKGIGAFGLRIYNDAKKEISEESEEKSEKTTEELKDEGLNRRNYFGYRDGLLPDCLHCVS